MRFIKLDKKEEGKFLTRYDIAYETADGKPKVYEMVSRNHHLKTREDLIGSRVDAVVLILTDENGERILLNREFRMAPGVLVYNFPAGLIDPGETPEESAARELREETGLSLIKIEEILPPSYGAVGFSNEKNICVIGRARGSFRPSTSTEEEIEAGWYTKAEVRSLLKSEPFSGRTQGFCYAWSREALPQVQAD